MIKIEAPHVRCAAASGIVSSGGDGPEDIHNAPAIQEPLEIPQSMRREPNNSVIPMPAALKLTMPNNGLEAIAAEVRELHRHVQDGLRRTTPQAIRIGDLLIEAK